MNRRTFWLALLAAAVAVVGVLWLRERAAPGAAASTAAPRSSDARGDADLAEVAAAEPAAVVPAPEPEAEAERAAVEATAPAENPSDATTAPPLAEIRGRFVLSSGAPAPGVALELRGWGANQERVLRYGKPASWRDPHATSNADGRFSIRFDPPLAFQFTLEANLAGYPEVAWRWSGLEAGAVTDVGDIELKEGGTVEGRLVDPTGAPVRGNWTVYATSHAHAPGDGGDQTRVIADADAASGRFRLERLPTGTATLQAFSQIANWIEGPTVLVRAGETVEADIVYGGPDNSRRIAVVTFNRAFYVYDEPGPGSIILHGAAGGPRVATKIEGSSQSWSFEDLAPGAYTIEVSDPMFLPWRREGVEPGTRVDAKLVGSATLALRVVDAATGQPVEPYRMKVRFRGVNFSPNVFEVRHSKDPAPDGGVYSGLMPVDQVLVIDADGYASCEVDVGVLAPGEPREFVARLGRGATLRARVLEADGTAPASGAFLRLAPVAPGSTAPRSSMSAASAAEDGTLRGRSGPDGVFVFDSVPPGTYSLSATIAIGISAELTELHVGPGDALEREIRIPARGALVGRLLGAPGASFEGMRLDVAPPNAPADSGIMRWLPSGFSFYGPDEPKLAEIVLEASGDYRAAPLLAGTVRVALSLPPFDLDPGPGTRFVGAGQQRELGTVEIRPGADTHADFDVRDAFPGYVRVTATVDGAPVAGLHAEAGGTRSFFEVAAQADLDERGVGRLGPLFPGEARVVIAPLDGSWRHVVTEPVVVPAGGEVSLEVSIAFHDGEVELRDAETDAPLADRPIDIEVADRSRFRRQTDVTGVLRARLPAGRYVLRDGGAPEGGFFFPGLGEGVAVEWSAAGASPALVRLPRAKPIEFPKPGGG